MSIPVFTVSEAENRYRENRRLTSRLYANPDYQEWLSRVLRPKLIAMQSEVMDANLLTEEGKNAAVVAQISYTALSTYLDAQLKDAGIAEEQYQKSLLRASSSPPSLS